MAASRGGQKAGDPIQVESHSKPKLSHPSSAPNEKTGLSNLVLTQVIKKGGRNMNRKGGEETSRSSESVRSNPQLPSGRKSCLVFLLSGNKLVNDRNKTRRASTNVLQSTGRRRQGLYIHVLLPSGPIRSRLQRSKGFVARRDSQRSPSAAQFAARTVRLIRGKRCTLMCLDRWSLRANFFSHT